MRRIYLAIAFTVFAANIFAQTPDNEGAAQFAQEFIRNNAAVFNKSATLRAGRGVSYTPSSHTDVYNTDVYNKGVYNKGVYDTPLHRTATRKQTSLFVFQPADNEGFVMVAQTGDNYAVVGYSGKDSFDPGNIPPQLRALMNWYEDSLRVTPTATSAMNHAPMLRAAGAMPLLDQKGIALDQYLHPEVDNCPSGCVATAFAQIMAYYQFPERGKGSACVSFGSRNVCADFENTTYNWDHPTDDDYKKLSLHTGIALGMAYAPGSSGVLGYVNSYRMNKHFGYHVQNVSFQYIDYLFQDFIDNGEPVYVDLDAQFHSVVVDGYDSQGLLHINYGWGGWGNGYYELRFGYPSISSGAVVITPYLPEIDPQDYEALVDFYNCAGGHVCENAGIVTGSWEDILDPNYIPDTRGPKWDLSQPAGSWGGIIIAGGRVRALDRILLYRENFGEGGDNEYRIPNSFAQLTELVSLSISAFNSCGNDLHLPCFTCFSLPENIGGLTNLKDLSLSGWTGNLPQSLWNLTNLKNLSLNSWYYKGYGTTENPGTISAAIGNMTELETLGLGNNKFAGSIPKEIGNCTKLVSISLSNNQLTGAIPAETGNCKNLSVLDLSNNQLTGGIPSTIGNLTKLYDVRLNNNQLTGNIPATIGNLSDMNKLHLNNNLLSGAIPAETGNLTNLTQLYLNDNLLEGDIPSSIGNLTALDNLHLQNNQLATVPSSIGNLTNLRLLPLNNNKITSIPESMGNLTKLQELGLSHNLLSTLPESLANLWQEKPENLIAGTDGTEGIKFDVSFNRIENLPDNFAQTWNYLTDINLSHNRLKQFPDNLAFLSNLKRIDVGYNLLDKFPKILPLMLGYVTTLNFDGNEISEKIPLSLLQEEAFGLNTFHSGLHLDFNRFTFEDLPQADFFHNDIGFQKPVRLNKTVFKAQLGDTIRLNVKELAPSLALPGNRYSWDVYHEGKSYDPVWHWDNMSKIHVNFPETNDPILTIVVDEGSLQNRYLCYIRNSNLPPIERFDGERTYQEPYWFYQDDYFNWILPFLATDTIRIELGTEEEVFADQNPGLHTLLSKNISSDGMSDHTVTLMTPAGARGATQWQASADGQAWMDISSAMNNAEIKANVQSVTARELHLFPQTTAFYRCQITDEGCDPIYSDEIKVNAYGKIVFDQTVSVTDSIFYVASADNDSIRVTIPGGFHDGEFNLKIVKLDQPPLVNEELDGALGSVYDVTVSCGSVFEKELLIRIKTANSHLLTDNEPDRFRAVYFDDAKAKWEEFDNARISLIDSAVVFRTAHLTKMTYEYTFKSEPYTHFYESGEVRVYYREEDIPTMQNYQSSSQLWHNTTDPDYITDAARYLNEVIQSYRAKGLTVNMPSSLLFRIYVKNLKGSEGEVSIAGMFSGYMWLNRNISNTDALRRTLAHEFMHYVQDEYISMNAGNVFWTEANATLADRIVWNEASLPVCEADKLMDEFNLTMYNYLSKSWDYNDRIFCDRDESYCAGSFLHYLRQYRPEPEKLDPVKLLKETPWFGSWRQYLYKFISANLNSSINTEWDNYIQYIFSGQNKQFSVSYPYMKLNDTFTKEIKYKFKDDEADAKIEIVNKTLNYLSAGAIAFDNQTPSKNVMVQLKRLHTPQYNSKVYFVQYNETTACYDFVDISSEEKYSFLLQARTPEAIRENKNQTFILLVNTDGIQAKTVFNASYEITAMPIINMKSIENVGIVRNLGFGTNIPVFSLYGTNYRLNNHSGTYGFSNTAGSSGIQMQNDSSFVVIASGLTTYSEYLGAGSIDSIRSRYTIEQQIAYNFITGEMTVEELVHRETWLINVTGEGTDIVTPGASSDENSVVCLKNIIGFDMMNETTAAFKAQAFEETQAVLVSIIRNGAPVDTSGATDITVLVRIKN